MSPVHSKKTIFYHLLLSSVVACGETSTEDDPGLAQSTGFSTSSTGSATASTGDTPTNPSTPSEVPAESSSSSAGTENEPATSSSGTDYPDPLHCNTRCGPLVGCGVFSNKSECIEQCQSSAALPASDSPECIQRQIDFNLCIGELSCDGVSDYFERTPKQGYPCRFESPAMFFTCAGVAQGSDMECRSSCDGPCEDVCTMCSSMCEVDHACGDVYAANQDVCEQACREDQDHGAMLSLGCLTAKQSSLQCLSGLQCESYSQLIEELSSARREPSHCISEFAEVSDECSFSL